MYLTPTTTAVWKFPTDDPKNILADIEKKNQPVGKERLHLESRGKTINEASVIL